MCEAKQATQKSYTSLFQFCCLHTYLHTADNCLLSGVNIKGFLSIFSHNPITSFNTAKTICFLSDFSLLIQPKCSFSPISCSVYIAERTPIWFLTSLTFICCSSVRAVSFLSVKCLAWLASCALSRISHSHSFFKRCLLLHFSCAQ